MNIWQKKKKCMIFLALLALFLVGAYKLSDNIYVAAKEVVFELQKPSLAKGLAKDYDIGVVFLSCDDAALYDYETGIFVRGLSYDDWAAVYGEEEALYHGNYYQRGDAWVRQASIAYYDATGSLTLQQGIGIAVSGGTSCIAGVKSLKIVADESYDSDADTFVLYLENGDVTTRTYSGVTEYNSLRLRIGAQDTSDTNIRSALVCRLAAEAGFDGMTATTRCVVYLNTDFCGIYDLQQTYSASYLADRFGLEDKESIEKVKGSELTAFAQMGLDQLFAADLDDEEASQALEAAIDMDNYLFYYAIEVLCNNTDCVNNNFEMWHYTGEEVEGYAYTDGRWRFLLYDMDCIYNTDARHTYFEGSNGDTFVQMLEYQSQQYGASLANVLASANYRDRFITLLSDLQNNIFATDHILSIVEEEYGKISGVTLALCGSEEGESLEQGIRELKKAVESRPAEIAETLATYFDLTDNYTSTLTTTPGVAVTWCNMTVYGDDNYTCDYYAGVSRVLTAEAYPGYTFVGWEIDGESLAGTSFEITFSTRENGNNGKDGVYDTIEITSLNENDQIVDTISLPLTDTGLEIRAVATRGTGTGTAAYAGTAAADTLILDAISAKGEEDWFRLYNASTTDILLSDYYISDDATDLAKDQLPAITLSPGEMITIYGSKSSAALTETSCNFALADGETLYVSDATGAILDQVYIPKMSSAEYYGRYDHSHKWLYHTVDATP